MSAVQVRSERQLSAASADKSGEADALVRALPRPDYGANYQPEYPDQEKLISAVSRLLSLPGITTPREVDALSEELAEVSDPASSKLLVITGSCKEPIRHGSAVVNELAYSGQVGLDVVARSGLNAVAVQRSRGQYKKPRTHGQQQLSPELRQGSSRMLTVPAYMGDVINGEALEERTPDPARLVAGAEQAIQLEAELTRRTGRHVPAAHEALSLPYEIAFKRRDPDTGRVYLYSADMPWAGVRTNGLSSAIIKMLTGLSNPTGVKIGSGSTESHIAGLAEALNPHNIPGKLPYMLRLRPEENDLYLPILRSIKRHAPGSLAVFDIHGITRQTPDGVKIRHVPTIIRSMEVMAKACKQAGVKFGGVHLETVHDDNRLECTDLDNELPEHPGDIDPRLNPRQTLTVLKALREILT